MNNFFKSILALGITSALGLSTVNAATYKVVDKGAVNTLKFTYSQQFNNAGQMTVAGTDLYDFPVQYDYLSEDDFDAIEQLAHDYFENVFGINDIEDSEALRAGNPTANDLYWVVSYLKSKDTQNVYQKVGTSIAMLNLGDQTEEVVIFDENFEGSELLTRSTTDYINGLTHNGWIYGNASAPYQPKPFTQSDGDEITYFSRAFSTRGYFSPDLGQTIFEILPPTENSDNFPESQHYGGESALLGMSPNSGFAVGFASVDINPAKIEFIENTDDGGCMDPIVLADLPFELCVQTQSSGLYDVDAAKWTIHDDYTVTVESLGTLITDQHEEDTRSFKSMAQAVNDHGVVVGYSHGWTKSDVTNPTKHQNISAYAVVFREDEVVSITEDHSTHFDSRAYDINNAGIAVGHTNIYVNGAQRTKAYWVDTNEDVPRMVVPESYFKGSASTARSINNHGFFVGEGEVETHNDSAQNPRRREAYIYDISSELVLNLNDLLECSSPYTIVEARDINDDNVIAASALVKQDRRDAKGNIMYEDDGVTPLREDAVRAVILEPIAGEIEECPEEDVKVVRQGAGFGIFSFLTLFGFASIRRVLKS